MEYEACDGVLAGKEILKRQKKQHELFTCEQKIDKTYYI